MKYLKFIGGIFAPFLLSCADSKNSKLIIGKSQGIQWQSNGKDLDRNIASTSFTFDD